MCHKTLERISTSKISKWQQEVKYVTSEEQKLEEQNNTIYNIEMLYKARKDTIKFFYDYSLMISEAKHKAKNKTSG